MIELYGSPTPNAYTIVIMLEEIGFLYSAFPIHKNNPEQLELEFLKMSPANIFPIVLDRQGPDGKPLAIFEPSAILLYLAEKSGKFYPSNCIEKFEVLQWLLFENSKIGPTLGQAKHFMFHTKEDMPYAVKRFNNETRRLFTILETQLSENTYLAGDYSIADIATFPWIKEYTRFGITSCQIPAVCEWLKRLEQRQAIIKGLEMLENLKEC